MKTKFTILLMLLAFTISFAMPKDNLEIIKKVTHEKVIAKKVCASFIDTAIINFDDVNINILQIAKVDRANIQNNYNSKRFNIYRIQESRFVGSFTKSRFGKNINTNKQNYRKAENSKIQTLYNKNIQERRAYKSRMYLRGIQESYRITKRGNYPIKRNQYFKRKYGYLSSIKNTQLGNAIGLGWRCRNVINNDFYSIYNGKNTKT